MAEGNLLVDKMKNLYDNLCRKEWNVMMTGVIIAILSILIMAWWRPWGAVGAVRNWGDWILYYLGYYSDSDTLQLIGFFDEDGDLLLNKSVWYNTGSVIGLGIIGGAFVSACLGGQFAFRFPPLREWIKAVIAGIFMGVGSALAGGCNVGGMYNAIGNLAANGFSMWLGLIFGVVFGLWLLYKEMEHISWGDGGAKTIDFPFPVQIVLGIASLALIIWGAYAYVGYDGDDYVEYINSLSGILLISAAIGYTMQRGRWCMVQGFREPHMTGDCSMAKSVMLSIFIVAVGAAILKYGVAMRFDGDPVLHPMNYVRGTFGWWGVLGGFIFGLGAMLAGGCGSGTLWRVGEGQMKLWLVVPFFGISNSLMITWFKGAKFEDKGVLGSSIYLPDAYGYGPTLLLVGLSMAIWYLVVTWNEDSNKLIVPM
ncbi:MAG: YeeE/YedE thiosulfate transporter family protein [Desulfobulbaceae bacterium]|nr:YeeE/YedE thiosulfate transporter family protein [Desulfobulbaceae bacterium]